MKKIIVFLIPVLFVLVVGIYIQSIAMKDKVEGEVVKNHIVTAEKSFQDGDMIFHQSNGSQGLAIQLATNSKYSHCGVMFKENNQWYVYEAVQPVKKTLFADFVKRGEGRHYVVKRLKDSTLLTTEVVFKMKKYAKECLGKNYDLYFEWSDDQLYCSELIWKMYQRTTNLEIGELQNLKDFDLSNPIVVAKLKERYGNQIPFNEKVIAPSTIYNSDLLITIDENN